MHQWKSNTVGLAALAAATACAIAASPRAPGDTSTLGASPGANPPLAAARVRPGITVLLEDSLHLIRGKRVALLTNHTGIDARRGSDIDLLLSAPARAAGVRLVRLFAPEHGIRGTEDRTGLASTTDERTGLPIVSLYGATTVAPPDSTLRDIDVIVFDLQDIGTRTWTYVGAMVYTMRAAARNGLPVIVLDRPNPIGGAWYDAPMLDSAIANAEDHTRERLGRAYALYPAPLRHGMTMGELALLFNAELRLHARLHVVPMSGWRREMFFDDTGLPWVRPSPNMPTLTSALLYPSTVAFEATNLSVGRGTPDAFQHIGAPWLDAARAVALLEERALPGVRFVAEEFTPERPTDNKYGGVKVRGIHIVVTDRARVESGRLAAALVWAVGRVARDSLRVRTLNFDLLLGSGRVRESLLRGEDPDSVLAPEREAARAFRVRSSRYFIY